MTNWCVGDPVVVLPDSNRLGGGEFTVAKVGRKYLTVVVYGRERRFSLKDGVEQGDGVGGFCVALTPLQADEYRRRSDASTKLYSLTSGHSWMYKLSVEDMLSIVGIIERANAREEGV